MPPKAPIPWTAALGKAAVPQRQEQAQAPLLLRVPEPEVNPEPAVELEPAAVAVAEAKETGAAEEVPPAIAAVLPVPFC